MLQELNKQMLISLNSLTEYEIIQKLVLFFADFPIFFLPIFLFGMWVYYTYKKSPTIISEMSLTKYFLEKENLLLIFYSTILGISISLIIQQFVVVDRPEEALKGVGMLLLNHIPDASFPSDHATVSVAFLTGLFLAGYKKIGYVYSFFVFGMLISRIIVGVHWPFDIIVGSLVGILSSLITFMYIGRNKYLKKFNEFIIKTMKYIKL